MVGSQCRLAAGLLVLAAVGCGTAFRIGNTNVQVAVQFDDQLVKNSIDRVAQKLERALRDQGLQVVVTNEGETVRVASTSRSGEKFSLVLTRFQGSQGEQTRIRTEWVGSGDRGLWLQLVAAASETALTK